MEIISESLLRFDPINSQNMFMEELNDFFSLPYFLLMILEIFHFYISKRPPNLLSQTPA